MEEVLARLSCPVLSWCILSLCRTSPSTYILTCSSYLYLILCICVYVHVTCLSLCVSVCRLNLDPTATSGGRWNPADPIWRHPSGTGGDQCSAIEAPYYTATDLYCHMIRRTDQLWILCRDDICGESDGCSGSQHAARHGRHPR